MFLFKYRYKTTKIWQDVLYPFFVYSAQLCVSSYIDTAQELGA